jgi:hypothetical protein
VNPANLPGSIEPPRTRHGLPSPKRLTALAGAGSLALLALAGWLYRDEIAEQVHFLRLHRDPAYLGKIIDRPEGTSARAAVMRYLESDQGKGALILECMPDPMRRKVAEGAAPRVYVVWSSDNRTACFSMDGGQGMVGATLSLPSARIQLIRDRFATGQVFADVPGYPGAIFEVAGANASRSGSRDSREERGLLEDS